jgi:FAD/FMN-containing dehydrogenase/Fe-S oxidoreductase
VLTPAQLLADLRPALRGGLQIDAATRAVYAADASPFHITPLAVAVPRDEADVITILKYAAENGLSVVPRGAGTGLTGESLGPGIVLDLSAHFRGLPVIDDGLVTVPVGLTYAELQAALIPYGQRIAVEVSNPASATVGGMVATNASGPNAAVHGTMREHVTALRVVWDDGSLDDTVAVATDRGRAIRTGLADVLEANELTIRSNPPRTQTDRCGYRLDPNLNAILTGSEGTLALITAATLRTSPLAGGTAAAVFGFPSLDEAARAALLLSAVEGLVACDLLDRRLQAMGKGLSVPADVEAILVVHAEAESDDAARETIRQAATLADGVTLAEGSSAPVREFVRSAVAGLYALGSGRRPLAFVEDVAVPPTRVPEYLTRVLAVLRGRDVTASVFAHCPTGVVHLRPLVDLNDPADREKLWPLADAVYAVAFDLGGTISGQHGVGVGRTPWVRAQSGPLADVFREVKRVFDPRNVFNPGKIVGPDPTRPAWPLRPVAAANRTPLDTTESAKCTGCGDCRPRPGVGRMCPVFRATGLEGATPRAKAILARAFDEPALLAEPEAVRAIAAKCVNCKMCKAECPAGVDVPRLMTEAKAHLWREHGAGRGGWFLARAESLIAFASRFTFTTNALLGTRPGRWLLARTLGLDPTLRLPAFRYRTFTFRAWARGWTRRNRSKPADGVPRLALVVDPLTNATDPLSGEAAVAVLRHHGAEVAVVPKARPTGLAALTAGDAEAAKDQGRRLVRSLGEWVRDGYHIVCLDPSSAVALTHDLPALLNDADATAVAAATVELMALLGEWHAAGTFHTDFREQDLWLGHHVPCHVKAFAKPAAPSLLSLIPGVRVRTADVGCSGMAGPWGAMKRNRADAVAAGAATAASLASHEVVFASSECASCRIQIQETTGKRAVHPVQYLAMAYGLLPEVGRRLVVPLKDRVSR